MTRSLTPLLVASLVSTALLSFGCEETEQTEPAKTTQAASETKKDTKDQPVKAEAKPDSKSAESKPSDAEKQDAEEKAAAAKKAQAEVEANPLTECCRALGKKGFTERSPDYMAASKACGESMSKKEDLAKALPGVKKALNGKSLPEECAK